MKTRNSIYKVFAFVFVSGVLGFSIFTRRSHAMDLKSQAPIGQFLSKDEVIPKLVTVTITPTKQGLEPQGSDSEKIPVFSREQLGSSLPVNTIDVPQQSNVSRYSSSAQSVQPQRSRSSRTLTNLFSTRGFGGSHRDPSGTGTGSLIGKAQGLDDPDKMYVYCFNRRIPKLEISAARKQLHLDLSTAKSQAILWNQGIAAAVKPEHKPQPLPANLNDLPNSQSIFGESEPVYVFSSKCRERITSHVKNLAKTSNPEALTFEVSSRKRKGKAKVFTGPTYNTKVLVFDDTVPLGHYIESFTFIKHYTSILPGARDNRGHALRSVNIEEMQGLVNSETAQNHFSTGEHYSSTHADLYIRKGQAWPNIGDISNHTGVAREPTNAAKIRRNATYNPNF